MAWRTRATASSDAAAARADATSVSILSALARGVAHCPGPGDRQPVHGRGAGHPDAEGAAQPWRSQAAVVEASPVRILSGRDGQLNGVAEVPRHQRWQRIVKNPPTPAMSGRASQRDAIRPWPFCESSEGHVGCASCWSSASIFWCSWLGPVSGHYPRSHSAS